MERGEDGADGRTHPLLLRYHESQYLQQFLLEIPTLMMFEQFQQAADGSFQVAIVVLLDESDAQLAALHQFHQDWSGGHPASPVGTGLLCRPFTQLPQDSGDQIFGYGLVAGQELFQ